MGKLDMYQKHKLLDFLEDIFKSEKPILINSREYKLLDKIHQHQPVFYEKLSEAK